jgi:Ner family transcriptional regulator
MSRHQPAAQSTANDWHKADIKAALEKRGWSLRSLAKHHHLSHGAIKQALRSRYPASEQRIADAIGVHPMVLWPSRYNKDGSSNGRRGNPNWIAQGKRSTRAAAVNVKSARAR